MLQVFGAGVDAAAGFQDTFGMSLSQFYADFNAWLTDSSKSAAQGHTCAALSLSDSHTVHLPLGALLT